MYCYSTHNLDFVKPRGLPENLGDNATWWAVQDLNLWPLQCECNALPLS
jgi:hypothetical protein